MTLEVLIVGRDSDVFGEQLGLQFPKLRFRCAHNSAEALALAPPCEILVVVGVGRIAEELAQRCKVFGMTVVGVSTRATAPGFDAMYPRAQIAKAAALADFLILLAPYTKENHHLVNAATIDAMKPDGVLINIARGGVLDEEALRRALLAGRIAGAGLDVFQTEPLPPE